MLKLCTQELNIHFKTIKITFQMTPNLIVTDNYLLSYGSLQNAVFYMIENIIL